jgi:uncharacterized protein
VWLVDPRQIRQRARAVFALGPPLELAVLFGSRASGGGRPDSDVDIAIVPKQEDLSLWQEGALSADLEHALGLPVDLVRLDRASTLLRWEVMRCGVPLHSDPPEAWARLLARVLAEHADFAPAAERAAQAYLRRLAAGGTA